MASFNPERAEVPLALPDGRELKLVMDYQAVGALIAKFGDQWDITISTASATYDCATLCAAVEIIAAKNHPELKAADVMVASPPWLSLVDALNAAHRVFLFGTTEPSPERQADAADGEEGDEEEGEERPLAKNDHAGGKFSPRRWQQLLRRVYGQASSGA